jgi:endogenous inhibitor of DNA gyrase (YacG/DUF329 family)
MSDEARACGGGQSRPCPVCARPSLGEHRPFCSARCRDVDLGRWLKGRYYIPGRRPGFGEDDEGGG